MDRSSAWPSPGREGNADTLELMALAAVLAYFAYKAVYFAFFINAAIFPDEDSWFGISELFSKSLVPPIDSADSYRYGLVTHTPILYFYVMGRLLQMNVLPLSDLMFLRCVNIGLVLLTTWYCWKLAGLLNIGAVARLLTITMLTNTMMFTFMAAAVNYDNLANLFAVLSLYYLIVFLRRRQAHHALVALGALLLGCLTKYTLLPYAMLLTLVTLYHERRKLPRMLAVPAAIFSSRKGINGVLTIFCLLALGANLKLYLGNWLEFGRLIPSADQVLAPDQAMQFRVFARNRIVGQFKRGEVSLKEAQEMVLEHIHHQGDRIDAFRLLQRAANEKLQQLPDLRLDRFRYAFVWADIMAERLYGVAAHRLLPKIQYELIPYYLIITVALAMMIRTISLADLQGMVTHLIFIVGGYMLILMQVQNYTSYRDSGTPGLATTGRYLFPVIAPAYILLSYYLLNSSRKWWVWAAGLSTAAVFVFGEFPWFLQRVSREWFF